MSFILTKHVMFRVAELKCFCGVLVKNEFWFVYDYFGNTNLSATWGCSRIASLNICILATLVLDGAAKNDYALEMQTIFEYGRSNLSFWPTKQISHSSLLLLLRNYSLHANFQSVASPMSKCSYLQQAFGHLKLEQTSRSKKTKIPEFCSE